MRTVGMVRQLLSTLVPCTNKISGLTLTCGMPPHWAQASTTTPGDVDDQCASAALGQVAERLEFAFE